MSRLASRAAFHWPARLHPTDWPVRWRLAAVSAGLTLAILLVFGAAVGQLTTSRIRDDFNREVREAAQALAREFRIVYTPLGTISVQSGPRLDDFVRPDGASARAYDASYNLIEQSDGARGLGPISVGLTSYDGMRVATAPVTSETGIVTGYVQYGRSIDHVESTVDRLWLLIAAGIIGGTLLASLAGVAIAARALRPISALTATAREIAETGDPSSHMPASQTADEVGELADTLEQMLRSLDAARTEREAALRKQREFVADASHELRTPLTSVLANLELLQASLHGSEQEDEGAMVDSALRSSRRMSRLVADLLLLARADAGRIGQRRPCDLAEVAGNAAVEVAPMLGERQLSLDNPGRLTVEGNPDELHRMILNLLDNAARHTPPGARIELRLHAEGGDAVVEVADDGPGIPAARREEVFDRFVRGEGPADTAVGPGSGLGLSIVRAVAAAHGGDAALGESARGGALFRIRIPLARAEQAITSA
jgi:signal transduction histidine kinase